MADLETPVQVGFAEFIARLMSEVFDSVITTQVDQEERYARLVASAALTEAEYADQHIDDEDAVQESAALFPPRPEDKDQTGAVYPGSPYFPAKGDQPENPAFSEILGMKMAKGDLERTDQGQVLTPEGVGRILLQIKLRMAAAHLDIARQIMARGLPRVLVDSGRINGKLTFHLTETGQEEDGASAADEDTTSSAPSRNLSAALASRGVFSLPKARILPNVRLMVKQADDTSPQSTQVKANVYGEVEITFKTVT